MGEGNPQPHLAPASSLNPHLIEALPGADTEGQSVGTNNILLQYKVQRFSEIKVGGENPVDSLDYIFTIHFWSQTT